jgi:ParB family chromosome partitioning protein
LDDGFTQVKLSKLIGKSQPYVSQVLKVLKLPQNILDEARESDVSKEHLLQLVKAKEPEQLQLWEKVKSGSTAEEVKTAVKTEKHPRGRPKIQPWTWKPKDKSFTVSIRFENRDYGNEEIIEALDQALQELKG